MVSLAIGTARTMVIADIPEVSPADAFAALRNPGSNLDGNLKKAALLDVRSSAECTFVGQPDLKGLQRAVLLSIEWQIFPGMRSNPDFLTQVGIAMQAEKLDPSCDLFVLCRSGARSLAAARAIVAAGMANAVNVTGGFEGDLDPVSGHRGASNGWKAAGLPWRQS